MITFDLITALVAFAFVTSITPGPNNLMLMTSGINYGFRRTLPHTFGVGIGFTVMIILIGFGLQEVFDKFPVTYQVLKIISIIFLSYLAWKIATATPMAKDNMSPEGKPFSFIQAAAFQWVNPKAWIMCVSAIGTYTTNDGSIAGILIVSLIFGLINLPSITIWVCMGTQLQHILKNPLHLRAFNIIAALLLIASLYPVLMGSSPK